MTTKINTYCNHCGRDLTYTGLAVDYRLSLANEQIPVNPARNITRVAARAPLDGTRHFCGIDCLRRWVNKETLKYAVKK